jgi:glucose uptake protein
LTYRASSPTIESSRQNRTDKEERTMWLPGSFSSALILMVLSTCFWGSWANSYKGARKYPFELFYWDYIIGVVLCSWAFGLTLGSQGTDGEPFLANLRSADHSDWIHALIAGAIFNVANLLLVAAVDIAGLAVAFPIAIGIALVEGVVLSYALQPKGSVIYLGVGIALAIAAVLFDARAYRVLSTRDANWTRASSSRSSKGIVVSVISGLLMGAFAPFVTRAMTHGHPLTPYGVAALSSIGALLCCFVANIYFMKHPIQGKPVAFGGYWKAGTRNHLFGVLGGVAWGFGGCFNFIAAGLVGVPISYAIGQSAPLIAAAWGVFVWREFAGAKPAAWVSLAWMFVLYIAAISVIARAY